MCVCVWVCVFVVCMYVCVSLNNSFYACSSYLIINFISQCIDANDNFILYPLFCFILDEFTELVA